MNIVEATQRAMKWYIECTPGELMLFSAEHNDVSSATELVALKTQELLDLGALHG